MDLRYYEPMKKTKQPTKNNFYAMKWPILAPNTLTESNVSWNIGNKQRIIQFIYMLPEGDQYLLND